MLAASVLFSVLAMLAHSTLAVAMPDHGLHVPLGDSVSYSLCDVPHEADHLV
jgi:hypothetical protein